MKKITSEDIIQASLSLFSEKGYEATSVDEIARRSGMVKASFYKYFKSKEELLQGTIAFVQEDMEKQLEHIYLDSQLSPREKLSQFYIVVLERVYQSKMHLLIFSVPLLGSTDERIAQRVEALENSLSERLLHLMTNLYGEESYCYYYDIIFVIKSMLISYVRMSSLEFSMAEHQMLADFVMSITDMLVQQMNDPNNDHSIMWKPSISEDTVEGKPWNRWQQITSIIANMRNILQTNLATNIDLHEYQHILELLQVQLSETLHETAHIKALLLFLEQIAELQEPCDQLKSVLRA